MRTAHSFKTASKRLLFGMRLPLTLPAVVTKIGRAVVVTLSVIIVTTVVSTNKLNRVMLGKVARVGVKLNFRNNVTIIVLTVILSHVARNFIHEGWGEWGRGCL